MRRFFLRIRLLIAPVIAVLSAVGGGANLGQGGRESVAIAAPAPTPTADLRSSQRSRGLTPQTPSQIQAGRGIGSRGPSGPAVQRPVGQGEQATPVPPQAIAVQVSAASLSIQPASVQPGGTVTISGDGFPARRTVLLAWDGSTVGMPTPRSETDGSFSVALVVGSEMAAGSHTVTASAWLSGASGPTQAEAIVQVAAPGKAGSATPTSTPVATPVGGIVAGQKCPDSVHDQYRATGPDGKSYATWHPATHSSGCWFGHEHGDNPAGAPALVGRPVLFGYAGAQAGLAEPHSSFKVFRWDNVNHPNAPSHTGSHLLMTLHQGTGGVGRFTTVHHSVQVDYINRNDGRELHLAMMAPFGTLMVGCGANDPSPSLRLRQADVSGIRQVSADKCFNTPNIPYEDWITALYIGTDDRGGWTAYFDPHFAVFEPSTYCISNGSSCTLGYSDVRAGTGADPLGPASQFKGTKREAYLNQVWVDNAGGSTTVWTDPYGKSVEPGAPGAIAQYICTLETRPLVNSAAFGEDRDHDDGTVRAPN